MKTHSWIDFKNLVIENLWFHSLSEPYFKRFSSEINGLGIGLALFIVSQNVEALLNLPNRLMEWALNSPKLRSFGYEDVEYLMSGLILNQLITHLIYLILRFQINRYAAVPLIIIQMLMPILTENTVNFETRGTLALCTIVSMMKMHSLIRCASSISYSHFLKY